MQWSKLIRTLFPAGFVALGALSAGAAIAQAYPSKPIRVIVPFSAGSTTDIIARALTDKLSASLGQPLVVENRGGAGGTIGATAVARAPADGYTILIHSSSHSVNPAIYDKLPFDTLRDFAGVTPLANLPQVLVVSPDKGWRTVKDLVAAAKAKPGGLTYASAGPGSATHLNAEKFRNAAGIDGVHVPFKGSPEAITEVMTGRVDYESQKALATPEVKERLVNAGAETMPMTPEQFDQYIKDEIAANAKLVKAAGIKVN